MLSKYEYLISVFIAVLLLPVNLLAQKQERIVDYRADYTEFNQNIGNGAQRLINNVQFNHAGAMMYCDSAYMYSKTNTFDAFEDIFINQGDTIHLFGDFLHYDGNTKLATIKGNVRLINNETTLTTDEMEYDLGKSIGYYTDYGHIVSGENTLESIIGYYYGKRKMFHFQDSVVIVNPDYIIYADTLNYHTETKVAYFFGPTDIIGDSSHIYCEYGWYDTKKDLSELRKNAWAKNNQQTVKGEYIYYDKISGDGIAKENVVIIDHKQDIILLGNDAKYNEIKEFAFITDSAQFIQFTEGDSLFLHGDSLITFPDTSGQKVLQAFNHVKFYRENVQGMCDSLVYTFVDSVARLFDEPILWTKNNQITAEKIEMFTRNQQVEKMKLYSSSFMTTMKDTSSFDQIKGKNMEIFFIDNQIDKIDVKANGQTVYYVVDGPDIVGVNKIDCTDMTLYFKEGELNDIMFYTNNKGALYPLDMAPENELKLKGFSWKDSERPKSKTDIFK